MLPSMLGIIDKLIDYSVINKTAFLRTRKKAVLEMAKEEVSILRDVNHDNIVSFYGAYKGVNEVIVVTEFLSGGELFEKVASDEYNLTELECIRFMHQICDGVAYLHSKVCNFQTFFSDVAGSRRKT